MNDLFIDSCEAFPRLPSSFSRLDASGIRVPFADQRLSCTNNISSRPARRRYKNRLQYSSCKELLYRPCSASFKLWWMMTQSHVWSWRTAANLWSAILLTCRSVSGPLLLIKCALSIEPVCLSTETFLKPVLDKDGEPFLIDLELASPHECLCNMAVVEGDMIPPRAIFDCDELFYFARKMKLWKPSTISYYGSHFSIKSLKNPEQLAAMAPCDAVYNDKYRAIALQEARRLFELHQLPIQPTPPVALT